MSLRIGIGVGMIPQQARPVPTTEPVNTSAPFFPAPLTQGQTVAIDPGSWTGLPSGAYEYKRQRWNGSTWVDVGAFSSSPNVTFDASDVAAGANGVRPVVRATNVVGPTTANGTVATIAAPLSISASPPAPSVGVAYSYTFPVSGGHAPRTSVLNGTPPAGLSYNGSTHTLSGTPLSTGTASGLSVTVTDADGLTASTGAFDLAVSSGGSTINAPFASVNADGWSVDYASQPTITTPVAFTVSRQGYDENGSATNYLDTLYVTKATRQPYPNQASQSALSAALSDYIYSTDTPSGTATNNSTEASPKPIANWVMLDRQLVGNSVYLEIVAAHRDARDGREVACVEFTVSDGTSTATAKVSETTVSARSTDYGKVIVYAATIDVSSLANPALLTCNAKVYPWIGDASSVLDSSAQTEEREFSPRKFYRNTTLFAAPRQAVVETAANGGNDGTGAVSTTYATAAAAPFATILAAINALHTAGSLDGAIIYLGHDGGTPHAFANPVATRTQANCALTITRKPGVARANARVANAFRPRFQWLRFHDVTWILTASSTFTGEAAPNTLRIYIDDADVDRGSINVAVGGSANVSVYVNGMQLSGLAASSFSANNCQSRLLRGVNVLSGAGTFEPWLIVGSNLVNNGLNRGTRTLSGGMFCFSRNSGGPTVGSDENVTGFALLQNILEYVSATTATSFNVSADSAAGDVTHMVAHNNTIAGAFNAGRSNIFYDETTADNRTHKLQSLRGNIHVQINTKGDVFKLDGTKVGNWAYLYGVGCQGEFSQYIDANSGGIGTSFAQAYPGRGSLIGTSNTTRQDPLFTDYKATTYSGGTSGSYTAGAGGGTYSLTSGSPAEGIVESAALSHDFAGNSRPANDDTAGAYAAAA